MRLPPQYGSLTADHSIGDWITVTPAGRVVVRTGKADLGQGISAALAAVVATELNVPVEAVEVVAPSTDAVDEGYTAGSMSMTHSGTALRLAARALRQLAGTTADRSLDLVSAARCDLGRNVLEVLTDADDPPDPPMPIDGPRRDLSAKVTGGPAFIHDMRLPGQVYARIVRRAGMRAVAPDPQTLADLCGGDAGRVVLDGSFIAVVADHEYAAIRGASAVDGAITWQQRSVAVGAGTSRTVADTELPPGVRRFELTYTRPNIAHASIGPACAVARWSACGDRLEVWTHSQGVHPLRRELATAFGLGVDDIRVQHAEGAGCYGHNGADDVAYDAALVARHLPGIPVQVTWNRAQELTCGPMGPRMEVAVSAETDDSGRIVAWEWSGSGEGHVCRPGMVDSVSLLAHADIADGTPLPPSADPAAAIGGGNDRNALPLYNIPVRRAVSTVIGSTIRTSAIRSLGAFLNVIATEGMIDEIATASGSDPAVMRLEHLSDPRARAVLVRALDLAGDGVHGLSRGVGIARYKGTGAWCAVVADIAAEVRVDVRSLTVVADVGRVASRDGVLNQLEGGALQAMSWTILERSTVRDGHVVASGWCDYPILRFPDVPRVVADVIDRPDEPYLGAGEAAAGPTGAAICNALAHALGVRVTELPLTPEAIMRAVG